MNQNQRQILLVEDEPIFALDMQQRLQRLGYGCIIASDGEKAVFLAGEKRPDLVLMDIMLEGQMDGVKAGGEIRRKHNLPLIYLSARSDAATFARAKVTEPMAYLTKPVDEEELQRAIQLALRRREGPAGSSPSQPPSTPA